MSYPRPVICAVCKFPTLYDVEIYDICNVCWWEEDGRGDGSEAVEDAKVCFAKHGHMYPPELAIPSLANPSPERVAIEDYLRSIDFDATRADVAIWGPLVEAESARSRRAAFPDGFPTPRDP